MNAAAVSRTTLAAIVGCAATLALNVVNAQAAEAQMATNKPDREHCYGIAKAGQNNCAAANGKHSCAGQAKVNFSGQEFKEVAKGTCEQMMGVTKPFDGINDKIKG